MTQKQINKEIEVMELSNLQFKAAASMVGYDVDAETKRAKEILDRRILVNMHQESRISFLKSLLKEAN